VKGGVRQVLSGREGPGERGRRENRPWVVGPSQDTKRLDVNCAGGDRWRAGKQKELDAHEKNERGLSKHWRQAPKSQKKGKKIPRGTQLGWNTNEKVRLRSRIMCVGIHKLQGGEEIYGPIHEKGQGPWGK